MSTNDNLKEKNRPATAGKAPLLLNEEQKMLKASAREYLKVNSPVSELRRLRDSRDPVGYDKNIWREMIDMGWSSLTIGEAYGGLNFGYTGLGQILEESGRTLTASPLISTVLISAGVISLGGSEKQKSMLLPAIAEGHLTVTLAFEEGKMHSPGTCQTAAVQKDGGFLISGQKRFVLDGHVSDKIIVNAVFNRNGKSTMELFIIDAGVPGLSVTRKIMMDSRNVADVVLENVFVSEDNRLSGALQGQDLLDRALDIGRIGLSAEMLGLIQESFDRTVAYLKERRQFGVPIGIFQGLQHRAAHLFCEIELCKTLVLKGLKAIDDDSDLSSLGSMIKAKVGEIAQLVTNEAIQMFGGIGVTDDEEIGLFMKRARVAQQTFGDYHYHLQRFAEINGF